MRHGHVQLQLLVDLVAGTQCDVLFNNGWEQRIGQFFGNGIAGLVDAAAQCEQVVIASTKYAVVDTEIVVDYDETSIAP